MGYFANGSEGMDYEEQFCRRCIHVGPEEGPGCHVWLAHLLFNYTQTKNAEVEAVLDTLIPRNGIHNLQCAMFVAAPAERLFA